MTWKPIPNNPHWEYNDAPAEPSVGSPHRALWLRQTDGVRTANYAEYGHSPHKVYVDTRRVGDTTDTSRGELSKSFWDAKGDEDDIETDMILVFRTTGANQEVRVGAATYSFNDGSGWKLIDYDASIDWGDGTTSSVTGPIANHAGLLHTFASAGDHTVRVSGPSFHKVNFSPGSVAQTRGGNTEAQTDRLLSVLNLGDVGHKDLRFAFYRTRQMTNFTLGHTDLSTCKGMGDFLAQRTWNMNNNAVPLTVDLTNLDMSGFQAYLNYSQAINFFKTSAVNMNTLNLTGINTTGITRMDGMFREIAGSGGNTSVANALNLTTIDVRPLNTSSVILFREMFRGNPTLTTITGIEDMDVSSGTHFYGMFEGTDLTGSLDLSSWDFSSGRWYGNMFKDSFRLTDIIGIETISVTNLLNTSSLSNFLYSVTLPTSRYDQLLINLAAQTKNQASQTAHFGSSKYTRGGAAEAARTSLINNDGYTITDGGGLY